MPEGAIYSLHMQLLDALNSATRCNVKPQMQGILRAEGLLSKSELLKTPFFAQFGSHGFITRRCVGTLLLRHSKLLTAVQNNLPKD